MGAPIQSEVLARALIADRRRELRRVDAVGWQTPPDPRRGTGRPVRRIVGGALMRLGARIAGRPGDEARRRAEPACV